MTPDPPSSHRHASTPDAGEGTYPGFRDELREMTGMQRGVVYLAIAFQMLLFIQSFVILPLIILKFGFGYGVD